MNTMIHRLLPHRTPSAITRLQRPNNVLFSSLSTTKPSEAVFRDVTIFNDGSPPNNTLLCVSQGSSLVIHMIADCRGNNNTATSTINVAKHNCDINMFAQPDGEEMNIADHLAVSLGIPHPRAEHLIEMGAVYISPFPPRKGVMAGDNMRSLKPEQKSLLRRTQKYVQAIFYKVKPAQFMYAPKRILDPSVMVKTGNYMKINMHPRRVPVAMQMTQEDWRKRILYEDDSIVVVNKPACIPTTPTSDNAHDNMVTAVGHMLGYTDVPEQMYIDLPVPRVPARRLYAEVFPYVPRFMTGWTNYCSIKADEAQLQSDGSKTSNEETRSSQFLHTPQKLDHGSSGCVIMAKTKDASSRVQRCITNNYGVKTIHKVLCFSFQDPYNTAAPSLPLGELTHYLSIRPASLAHPLPLRSTAFDHPESSLKEAKLVVLGIEQVSLGMKLTQAPVVQLWEVEMELLTSRTHQIRTQIEPFGLCVVGDEIYPKVLWAAHEDNDTHTPAALLDGRIGIHVSRVEIDLGVVYAPVTETDSLSDPFANQSNGSTNGPNDADINDRVVVAEADDPWWQSRTPEAVRCMVDTQLDLLRRQGAE